MKLDVIYNEDCLVGLGNIPDGAIDMVLCDLPYGTTQCSWDTVLPLDALWRHYKRIVKPNGAIVLTGAEPFSSLLRLSNLDMFKYDWVWHKIKGTGFLNAKKQPLRNHECISVFYKKQPVYNPQKTAGNVLKKSTRKAHLQTEVYGRMEKDYTYESTERYPKSVLTFNSDTQNSSLHPTQKPIELFRYLIRTYTDVGHIVLDNCAGSGTSAIACIRENRRYVCFEKDPIYARIAEDRVYKELLGDLY